jgi:hypothetical protein
LARQRDSASYSRFAFAVRGLDDEQITLKLIDEFAAHRGETFVPSLIAFLENDACAPRARQELRRITGIWFPFDCAASLAAWEEVDAESNRAARELRLARFSQHESPFRAELIGAVPKLPAEPADEEFQEDRLTAIVRLQNVSKFPVTILKNPSAVTERFGSGAGGFGWMVPRSKSELEKDEFVTLAAGSSLEIKIQLFESFVRSDPAQREVQLGYANLGSAYGPNPWIGEFKVELSPAWKKREEAKVEELWPNGNLKTTGTLVNGERFGEWNFFNEAGDRTSITYYQQGRGSATCNPEHPTNKGAGIRKK